MFTTVWQRCAHCCEHGESSGNWQLCHSIVSCYRCLTNVHIVISALSLPLLSSAVTISAVTLLSAPQLPQCCARFRCRKAACARRCRCGIAPVYIHHRYPQTNIYTKLDIHDLFCHARKGNFNLYGKILRLWDWFAELTRNTLPWTITKQPKTRDREKPLREQRLGGYLGGCVWSVNSTIGSTYVKEGSFLGPLRCTYNTTYSVCKNFNNKNSVNYRRCTGSGVRICVQVLIKQWWGSRL